MVPHGRSCCTRCLIVVEGRRESMSLSRVPSLITSKGTVYKTSSLRWWRSQPKTSSATAAFLGRHRSAGWPHGWDPTFETAEQFLERQGCRCFEVTCSYGMVGWVAAVAEERQISSDEIDVVRWLLVNGAMKDVSEYDAESL